MATDLAIRKQNAQKRIKKSESDNILREYEEKTAALRDIEIQSYIDSLTSIEALTDPMRSFLGALSLSGVISDAARATGIPVWQYYTWCEVLEFKLAADEAKKYSNDRLELIAIALATGQYMRPIVSMGKIVTYEPIYDAKLLTTLLKSRMPDRYAQKIDITSNGHSIVKLVDKDAWDSVSILLIPMVVLTYIIACLSGVATGA